MKAKKHGWMLFACLITALLTLGYLKITRDGGITVTWMSLVWVLAFTAILAAAAELGRLLFKKLCPKLAAGEKGDFLGMRIGAREIMGIVFCVILTVLSFVPVMLDAAHHSWPMEMTPELILDTYVGAKGLNNIGPVTRDTVAFQSFECPCEYLDRIELKAATYGRKNESRLMIVLEDAETLEEYDFWEINSKKLEDGDAVTLQIRNPEARNHVKGKSFLLEIYGDEDAVNANSVSLYCAVNNTFENFRENLDEEQAENLPEELHGTLQILDEEQGGILLMAFWGDNEPEILEGVRIWMCVYTALAACAAVWMLLAFTSGKKKDRKKAHKGKAEEK